MTHWEEFSEAAVEKVPNRVLGIFQLARGEVPEKSVAYVGASYSDLRAEMQKFLGKGYTHCQWVKLPWTKEVFEMHCRLYHHYEGYPRLDNSTHPEPPTKERWNCTLTSNPPALCDEETFGAFA